jgi:hypothetical protein
MIAKEISKYKLNLVGVQVRRNKGGTEPAGEHTFFYGKWNETRELGVFCMRVCIYIRESHQHSRGWSL